MAEYTYASELFLNELLRISSGIVWKDSAKALACEDPDNTIEIEQYLLAYQGKLTFDIVYRFHKEALMQAGLNETLAEQAQDEPYIIPEAYRNSCVASETNYVLSHYEEKNNYYRMLHGIPDYGDTNYLYNLEYPEISDSTTPIHLLNVDQLSLLEGNGYIAKLLEQNPSKKYLNHMTEKKIDVYTARNSEEYAILRMRSSDYDSLVNDFKETYNSCRYMISSIFQLKTIKDNNTQYNGFMAMSILFATIQQMHRLFLDTDITRDFYDEDSLKYVYDSYGVPYFESVPLEFHRKIVKNINRLISYKGSTNVLYELFDIFGLSDMSIYEFYMIKIHKFENGKPVFVKDENGNDDLQKMYDVKFAKVRLYDDPATEIANVQNHVDYHDMVDNDPYWISDKDLIDKIYSEEYNYLASKYLGIQTSFNLMQIMYESCYYLKMIIDNRVLLSTTSVYNNNTRSYCNIFDLIIYACALICKKYGYEGNIPNKPHEIGKIMGFNFKADLTLIKNNIQKDDYLKNDKLLLTYLKTMNVNSLNTIYKVFNNLTALRKYLVNKMHASSNPKEYFAYYEIYNTIMYSEYIDSTFVKSDKTVATSFKDLLADINPGLHDRLLIDEGLSDTEMSDVLYLIKSSCKSLTHIQYMDDINIDLIIEYLFKLSEFFKSAKADMTGYEIIFSLASRTENIMKMLDWMRVDSESYLIEDMIYKLKDFIKICRDEEKTEIGEIQMLDTISKDTEKRLIKSVIQYFEDKIKLVTNVFYGMTENHELIDVLEKSYDTMTTPDVMTMTDYIVLRKETVESDS